jgi:hypothetical protein
MFYDGLMNKDVRPPESADPKQSADREAKAKVDEIAAELRAMFAGEPSLEDEYFRDRDKDKW